MKQKRRDCKVVSSAFIPHKERELRRAGATNKNSRSERGPESAAGYGYSRRIQGGGSLVNSRNEARERAPFAVGAPPPLNTTTAQYNPLSQDRLKRQVPVTRVCGRRAVTGVEVRGSRPIPGFLGSNDV